MTTEISRKIHNLMAKEMGHMGKFIIKKQCDDLGLKPDEIKLEDLPKLSQAVMRAIVVFTGQDKAKRVAMDIKRLK
jgi:hypothetical protein